MPIEIPNDLQARLHALAQQTGEDGDAFVRRAIEARLALPAPQPDPIPIEAACGDRPMLVNSELIQRIEDVIAAERSAFADGMAALQPESGASWLPVAGGRAIFTGADFFSNRALAMGLHAGDCHCRSWKQLGPERRADRIPAHLQPRQHACARWAQARHAACWDGSARPLRCGGRLTLT